MKMSPTLASGTGQGERSLARWNGARGVAIAALAAALSACAPASGVLDRANELPFGHVDQPVAGATLPALSPVSGWALDDRDVREIRVYVDNHFINSGRPTQPRPDVSRAYPRYARPGHRYGWTLLLGFDAPGPHTVLVQAIDSSGAARDIGVLSVTSVDK
jgi:hypothetical protein